MQLVDTHCHIHLPEYPLDADAVRQAATDAGVTRLICVGCTLHDSQAAVAYAEHRDNVWVSIGLHPHEASRYVGDSHALQQFHDLATRPKVIAVGETGLDYYYDHSPREAQKKLLRFQLDIASEHNLPLIFHVRDAFDDFWQIFDEYHGLRGVIHSFSATPAILEQVLSRGLHVGLNGIMTFTKDVAQLEAAKKVPLDRLVLETDAPFLTPVPFRGKVCEPKHVAVTAEFLADLRGESVQELAAATTQNAQKLFTM